MTQRLHNPFNTLPLVRPVEQEDDYRMYCQTRTKRTSLDRCPFPRMADLWFAGMSLAARRRLAPVNLTRLKTSEFVEGSIFDRDSWRIQVVMLVAIAVENDVAVVLDPPQDVENRKRPSCRRRAADCRNATGSRTHLELVGRPRGTIAGPPRVRRRHRTLVILHPVARPADGTKTKDCRRQSRLRPSSVWNLIDNLLFASVRPSCKKTLTASGLSRDAQGRTHVIALDPNP